MKFSNAALTITLCSGSYVGRATASRLNIMKPSFLTAMVLLSNGVRKASGQYFPFVKIGQGSCLDSSDRNYPYIVGQFGSGTFVRTDPQTCIDWCTQAPQHIEKLVGIEVSSYQRCYCRFDTAVVGGVSASDFSSPDPTGGLLDTHIGTGNIDGHSTNNSDRDCYRNEVSPLSAVF